MRSTIVLFFFTVLLSGLLDRRRIAQLAKQPSTIELTERVLLRLAHRLPDILAGPGGSQITIHIAPGGRSARIVWPPDSEQVSLDSPGG
jgi:hypothetical protein